MKDVPGRDKSLERHQHMMSPAKMTAIGRMTKEIDMLIAVGFVVEAYKRAETFCSRCTQVHKCTAGYIECPFDHVHKHAFEVSTLYKEAHSK